MICHESIENYRCGLRSSDRGHRRDARGRNSRADFITGTIEERVEKETGLQLDINGGATIKLWPLTVVTLSDVALFDPKDKDVSERFRAESIRAELSLRGLLPAIRACARSTSCVRSSTWRWRVNGRGN